MWGRGEEGGGEENDIKEKIREKGKVKKGKKVIERCRSKEKHFDYLRQSYKGNYKYSIYEI